MSHWQGLRRGSHTADTQEARVRALPETKRHKSFPGPIQIDFCTTLIKHRHWGGWRVYITWRTNYNQQQKDKHEYTSHLRVPTAPCCYLSSFPSCHIIISLCICLQSPCKTCEDNGLLSSLPKPFMSLLCKSELFYQANFAGIAQSRLQAS